MVFHKTEGHLVIDDSYLHLAAILDYCLQHSGWPLHYPAIYLLNNSEIFTLIRPQLCVFHKRSQCFLFLSHTEGKAQSKAHRKHIIYDELAPRQALAEFISQSNAVFPPAEVSCLLLPWCFCAAAQHTWEDDAPKKRARLVLFQLLQQATSQCRLQV